MFVLQSTGYGSAARFSPIPGLFLATLLGAVPLSGYGQFGADANDIIFNPVPLAAVNGPAAGTRDNPEAGPATPGRTLVLVPRNDEYTLLHGAIRDYRAAIHAIEEQSGLYTPALFENLVGLATQYEKLGEYELALAEYERASHIDRINNGLYTPEQIDIIGKSIRLLEKLNRFDEAGKHLDNYVYMHEKLYGQDSVKIVEALDRLADWQFRAFRMSMAQYQGESAAMVSYFNGLALDSTPRGILEKTQHNWMRAIRLLVENHAYNNPLLPMLEDKLLETYFVHASLGRMIYGSATHGYPGNTFSSMEGGASAEIEYINFANGVDVFKRKLHYLQQADAFPVTDYADTLVALGDWYLLFGRRVEAMESYDKASHLMQEYAVPAAHQANLLHPAVPVSLTDIDDVGESGKTETVAGAQYTGWIDVMYTLNRFGRAGKVRMLDASDNTGKHVSNQLLRQVRSTQFRPYLRDSREEGNEQVALRYYYRH